MCCCSHLPPAVLPVVRPPTPSLPFPRRPGACFPSTSHPPQSFGRKWFNMSHTIKHLSFGTDYPGLVNPLDNHDELNTYEGSVRTRPRRGNPLRPRRWRQRQPGPRANAGFRGCSWVRPASTGSSCSASARRSVPTKQRSKPRRGHHYKHSHCCHRCHRCHHFPPLTVPLWPARRGPDRRPCTSTLLRSCQRSTSSSAARKSRPTSTLSPRTRGYVHRFVPTPRLSRDFPATRVGV